MAYTLPNGSTMDVAATYDAAVPMTTITNAAPAVVGSLAHGLTKGDIVLVTSGWSRLNNRAFVVGAVTTDTFELAGTDTTDIVVYPAGGGVGTAKAALTYVQINQITGVEFSGGDISFLDVQFLESDSQVQIPTVKSAISMILTVADDPGQAYLPVLEAYDANRSINIMRLNLVNGNTILYPAITTINATPTVTINELLTRSISAAVQAQPTRYERT